jgi:hypothetical protein
VPIFVKIRIQSIHQKVPIVPSPMISCHYNRKSENGQYLTTGKRFPSARASISGKMFVFVRVSIGIDFESETKAMTAREMTKVKLDFFRSIG